MPNMSKRIDSFRFEVLPTDGPRIFGGRLFYQVGDEVNISCVCGPSKPATHLVWFVNGDEAATHFFRYSDVQIDADGLETTSLGLKFAVQEDSFLNGLLTLKVRFLSIIFG